MFLDKPPMVVIQFRPSGAGRWVGGYQSENNAQCGPTCKIARFQAGLKFPSWSVAKFSHCFSCLLVSYLLLPSNLKNFKKYKFFFK